MSRVDATDRRQAVIDFLQSLARAARQFRTYPPTSTLCSEAIDACHRSFAALGIDEPLLVRVTSQHLLVFDEPVPADTAVEQELRRPLHASRVGSIECDLSVSARDWTQFCTLVAAARRAGRSGPTLAERLMDAGVSAIVPRMTPRPEVIRLVDQPAPVRDLLSAERARQAAATPTGPAQYLYPPDKGWVRLDPTVDDHSISLTDLTLLVGDPTRLASTLARLVDDAVDGDEPSEPLRDRYDDVVTLIGALEPRLGRLLLAKLSRAVLDLDADRRRALLRRSILPHLIDGRVDAEAILTEFPDVDLADALGLLFDLEMASPQLLPLALDRLHLAADRRTRVVPLIEEALGSRPSRAADRWAAAGFDDQARKLTHVDAAPAKQFGDFAAFDLSIDEATRSILADAKHAIEADDSIDTWLACVLRLARIEPNPSAAAALLGRAVPLVQGFVRQERWQDAARWLSRVAAIAPELETIRPDVAASVHAALARFCDRETLLRLAALCGTETGKAYVPLLVAALGRAIVPAWLDILASAVDRPIAMRLRPAVCECAVMLAPAVAARRRGRRRRRARLRGRGLRGCARRDRESRRGSAEPRSAARARADGDAESRVADRRADRTRRCDPASRRRSAVAAADAAGADARARSARPTRVRRALPAVGGAAARARGARRRRGARADPRDAGAAALPLLEPRGRAGGRTRAGFDVMTPPPPLVDAHRVLKSFAALKALTGMYPAGHPL